MSNKARAVRAQPVLRLPWASGAMEKIACMFAALMVCTFAAFAYFGYLADSAMSKDGVGNLSEFMRWSDFAGVAFWVMCGFWLGGVVAALLSPSLFRGRALFAIGLLLPTILSALHFGGLLLQ